jgi:hypothetical protein
MNNVRKAPPVMGLPRLAMPAGASRKSVNEVILDLIKRNIDKLERE